MNYNYYYNDLWENYNKSLQNSAKCKRFKIICNDFITFDKFEIKFYNNSIFIIGLLLKNIIYIIIYFDIVEI